MLTVVGSVVPDSFVVDVAQLVRASDCGSEGRGFKSHLPPHYKIDISRKL